MVKKSLLAVLTVAASLSLLNWSSPYAKAEKQFAMLPFIEGENTRAVYTKEIKELEKKADDFYNYRIDDFQNDTETRLLARMLFGEVASRPKWEKMEIGSTPITRMSWGISLKKAILQPEAYSCFNPWATRLSELKDPLKYGKTEFLDCLKTSEELLEKKYKSLGATHYYNPDIVKKPEWANWMKFLGKVGPHKMYK